MENVTPGQPIGGAQPLTTSKVPVAGGVGVEVGVGVGVGVGVTVGVGVGVGVNVIVVIPTQNSSLFIYYISNASSICTNWPGAVIITSCPFINS